MKKNSKKKVLTFSKLYTIILLVLSERAQHEEQNGVWLSLARAPGLGPGGRRFESCHPDLREQRVKVRACMRT